MTANGGTTLSNLRISLATSLASGLSAHFQGITSYTQNNGTQGTSAGNYPADDTVVNGAAPSTFTAMTTSTQVYDSTGGVSSNSAAVGKYCETVFAVDGTNYAGGGNASTAVPNLTVTYDEA